MAWHGRCRTSRGAGRRSVIQKLEGERLMTADQLEIVAIERVEVGPHPARTAGQQDVVEHLLTLGLATGLTTSDQGHQFAGLLPVFEERRDQPPDALEGPDLALDQAHGPVVQSSRVEFLDDNAGQVGLKDKGQELSLEPGRAGGGLQGVEIHVCIEQDRHAGLPIDVDESAAAVTDESAEGPLDLAVRHGVFEGPGDGLGVGGGPERPPGLLEERVVQQDTGAALCGHARLRGKVYYAATSSVISRIVGDVRGGLLMALERVAE